MPARHAAEATSHRPGGPGRCGQGAGDPAAILSRAKAAGERAQQLIEESRELLQRSPYARLRAQLETMPVIEQAKGILMAQSRCSDAEAFDLLRRASQRSNIPVRELAARLVASTARPPDHQQAGKIP